MPPDLLTGKKYNNYLINLLFIVYFVFRKLAHFTKVKKRLKKN